MTFVSAWLHRECSAILKHPLISPKTEAGVAVLHVNRICPNCGKQIAERDLERVGVEKWSIFQPRRRRRVVRSEEEQ